MSVYSRSIFQGGEAEAQRVTVIPLKSRSGNWQQQDPSPELLVFTVPTGKRKQRSDFGLAAPPLILRSVDATPSKPLSVKACYLPLVWPSPHFPHQQHFPFPVCTLRTVAGSPGLGLRSTCINGAPFIPTVSQWGLPVSQG